MHIVEKNSFLKQLSCENRKEIQFWILELKSLAKELHLISVAYKETNVKMIKNINQIWYEPNTAQWCTLIKKE